ncbi:Z1 domain [Burkholderia pseudomallei]|uniref:Z1 domain-containing protein n=1 Tax=Burkholderia pseudomallei TaxID=28450 RepID=UPI000F05BE3B|nr:Z1 domain-containing protein [Burkholderia pseudomallei]CAJ2745874.1 Z1 domain [Burkholderia pseudomallei]VCJ93281.1 Z1 domain [Burkholderia pseudomallei]VCJ94796.1 Z1 domain [Burkholderia pseudomallei]VCJ95797.1 Z1 domain [Burkholderia pseudomallei]VCJ97241.1 Z1 domain [Burkholderia pseudomallei]
MGFYSRLREQRGDDEQLQKCIENVVDQLDNANDPNKPGMLLGKIQSGKTRAFLGVIARAFDRDYDIAIVLTKGTKTLASQTVKRIGRDFKTFIDNDEIVLFDIMSAPDPLTKSELRRKIIIVAKKQAQNLSRIQKLFEEKYPTLKDRRVLLVDDEADMASVRFSKKKGDDDYDQGTIANQMDELRGNISRISFLQVTATPYALYLQPENYEEASQAKEVFYPKKPSFTELLPIHDAYVGGDAYFGGHGADDPRHYLYVEVDDREHDALRSNDGRAIREDRLWSSENIRILRRSLIGFLLSVAIRRRQQHALELPQQKYAMIIHNDTQRAAHTWQWETVQKLLSMFESAVETNDQRLRTVFDEAYSDLSRSVTADRGHLPSAGEAFQDVCELIGDGELNVQRVNSDVQLEPLLDSETAELKLRTKANLFIGGSILDRGITVPNLLAFYYGRNPKRMQADTVLQHSRMYGARPKADLAVTRFYTSRDVYSRLVQIHSLETALREAFESGAHDGGVVFIQSDARGGVIPCAPSKISLSDVIAVKPNDVLLPTGFDTIAAGKLRKAIDKIDRTIPQDCLDTKTFVEIELSQAISLIDNISETLVSDGEPGFDWEAMKGLLNYYAAKSDGRVLILAEQGRRLSKAASGDRSGISILGTAELRNLVREPTRQAPAIVLLKQDGGEELGWKAGPFWWPMLASPPQASSCVFATKVAA